MNYHAAHKYVLEISYIVFYHSHSLLAQHNSGQGPQLKHPKNFHFFSLHTIYFNWQNGLTCDATFQMGTITSLIISSQVHMSQG